MACAVVTATALSGCSSTDEPSQATPREIYVPASDSASKELGVNVWVLTPGSQAFSVRGVASPSSSAPAGALVELTAEWQRTPDTFTSTHHVRFGKDTADVKVRIQTTGAHESKFEMQNTFGNSPASLQRAYQLLDEDLKANDLSVEAPGAKASPSVSLTANLRPRDNGNQLVCGAVVLTKCASGLTCRNRILDCANPIYSCPLPGPGLVETSFNVVATTLTNTVGDLFGDTPAEDINPIKDCVDAIKNLPNCGDAPSQCLDAAVGPCPDEVKEQCQLEANNIRTGVPCNAGTNTITCDAQNKQVAQAIQECMKCHGL